MAYSTEEGYYTVGDLGAADESFITKYRWYLVGAAVLAAAGAGYYYMKKKGGAGVYGMDGVDDLGDTGCGCE